MAPVIQTVIKHLIGENISLNKLPRRQCVQNVVDEAQYLMKCYYGQRLQDTSHWGLYRDGTSRQKRKIMDTAITLDSGEVLPLGFRTIDMKQQKVLRTIQYLRWRKLLHAMMMMSY